MHSSKQQMADELQLQPPIAESLPGYITETSGRQGCVCEKLLTAPMLHFQLHCNQLSM